MTDITTIVLSEQSAPTAFFIRERNPFAAAGSIAEQLATAKERGDDSLWDDGMERIRLYVSLRPADAGNLRMHLKETLELATVLAEDRSVILNACRQGDVDRREALGDIVRIDNLARDEERTRLTAQATAVHLSLLAQMEQFFDSSNSAAMALKKV